MASNAAVRGLGASSPQVVAPQAKKKWPLVQLYGVWGQAPSAAGEKKLASSAARGAEITQTFAEFVRSTQSSWRKTKPAVEPPRPVLCCYERRFLSKVFGVDVRGSRLTPFAENVDTENFTQKAPLVTTENTTKAVDSRSQIFRKSPTRPEQTLQPLEPESSGVSYETDP